MTGKKYQEIKSKIEPDKEYSLSEAIDFIKENKIAKFDESIEIHIHLGINPRKTEQQVRGMVVLPEGAIKTKRVAAFVTPAKEKEAKEAGADLVGGKSLIEEIKNTGKCEFDVAVAEPELMKEMSLIAKILGPKGMMPNPKTETVTIEIKKVIELLKKGKINFKSDAGANIHQAVGKVSWPKEKIKNNAEAFLDVLKKLRPGGVKGNFIKTIVLSSTMGPGLKIQL